MHNIIINVSDYSTDSYDIENGKDFPGDYATEIELGDLHHAEDLIKSALSPLIPFEFKQACRNSPVSFSLMADDLRQTEIEFLRRTASRVQIYLDDIENGTTNSQFWNIKTMLSDGGGVLIIDNDYGLVPLNDWIDSVVTDARFTNQKDGVIQFKVYQIFDYHM